MVSLPGGRFVMGNDGISVQGELDYARPSHDVTVPPFKIDVTEVTVAAYRRCVDAGVCSLPTPDKPAPTWPTCKWFEPDREEHPINCVDWNQANTYCKWVGKELPSEEMWEFAARGKEGREFPWGRSVPGERYGAPDDIYDRLEGSCRTPDKESDYNTCPVGSAPRGATPEGVLDLAGNVKEWTSSVACEYGKKSTCDQKLRIVRGGRNDWFDHPYQSLVYFRAVSELNSSNAAKGFRCAKSEKP